MVLLELFYTTVSDVLAANISLILIAGTGIWLSNLGILCSQAQTKQITKLVEQLFSPCLIFSSFLIALDIKNIGQWLPVTILACLSFLQGCALGKIINKFILKDFDYDGLIVISSGLAMTTNIQFNLAHNLSDYLDKISLSYTQKFNIKASGYDRAITYIMIYTLVNTILRWTVGKYVIEKMQKDLINLQNQNQHTELTVIVDKQSNNLNLPNKNQKYKKQKLNSENKKEIQKKPDSERWYHNPPLITAIFTILITLIPNLQTQLIKIGGFLYRAILQPAQVVGSVNPPLTLILLGAILFNARNSQTKLKRKTLIGITVIRLVINPLVGGIFLYYLQKFEIIKDPVISFVCQISYSTPTAINLLIISSLYSDISTEVGSILKLGYMSYILTLPIVMIIFFSLMFDL